MAAPSFEYKGVTYLHTESQWRTCTNRHTTTLGYSWGWIEGPKQPQGGDYCWSNDPGERFKQGDAVEVVRIHNEWLASQEPVAIRLIKAHRSLALAELGLVSAEDRLRDAKATVDECNQLVDALEAELKTVAAV